jgi:hypothetical protein
LTNTGQRLPLSVKAIVVQIEMSLTLLTKASKGKGPTTTDDTEEIPPTPVHKSGRHKRQPVDRSVVVLIILSSSIAIDKDPPIILIVKGTNDQSDQSSNLPLELEAV